MKKSIFELYYMYLGVGWQLHRLVISKNTGGVFARHVIADGMMKNYTSVQRYFYPDGWMAEDYGR